jgi:hypothetical protein
LGDVVLLVAVGLLEAALDGDDPLRAGHLELEVGVVGDSHELGEAWSTEEAVVDTEEVNNLEGERLLAKVVWLAEGDVEPDAPEGHDFLPRHDPVEQRLAGAQAALRDAHLVEGGGVEYVEAAAPVHQHLGEARGAHDRADQEWVAPWMGDAIRMVFLGEGDGCLGPSEPRPGGEGVGGVHLLLGDAALPAGFIRLGAFKDHEAALGLGEHIVFLLGAIRRVTGLQGRLLGLALLAEGAMDVAFHGGAVLEKILRLPPVEWAGGLERLLKVFWACSAPAGLRSGGTVGRDDHLLPAALSVLVPPVAASLGRGRIIGIVTTAEVASNLGFPAEVGLDSLLAGGVLGGNVQELPRCVRGLATECMDEHLVGHATDEGIDHVSVGDVWELIAFLGEALNVLLEGLIGPLLADAEILGVPQAGVGTLKVADEDHTEITPAADAARLELLKPSPG